MNRIGAVAMTIAVTVLLASSPAAAQPIEFTVPIDTVVNQPAGSTTLLATFDVPADRQGLTCNAEAFNQSSVHPGNNLILESGGATAVIEDVESAPDVVTPSSSPLVLGPTLSVSLLMGQDGVFSGGIVITVGCPSAPPTTVTPTTVTPTTAPPATVAPGGGVSAAAPATTAPSAVSPAIIPVTGHEATEPVLIVGLALIVAGGFLVVLVELHRRMKDAAPRR